MNASRGPHAQEANISRSNVKALISDDMSPEALLRDALARIAKARADGQKPGVLVVVALPGFLPLVSYGGMHENTLAAVAMNVQLAAHDAIMACESAFHELEGER